MRPGTFTGSLYTEWVNRRWVRVFQHHERKFFYTTSDGLKLQPPDKFLSDGGSIPWWIQWLLPCHEFLPCYIIHDTLCSLFNLPRWLKDYYLVEMIYTITCADAFFKRNLVRLGLFLFRIFLKFKSFFTATIS